MWNATYTKKELLVYKNFRGNPKYQKSVSDVGNDSRTIINVDIKCVNCGEADWTQLAQD